MSRQKSAQDDPREPLAPEADTGGLDLSLATTAHDLNQMLAVISGRLGLLQAKIVDPVVLGHLAAMVTACRDAADLVGRLRGGEPALGSSVCDPAEEAMRAAGMIFPSHEESLGGSCEVELVPGELAGLPGQVLREVLVNLLVNSREAMADEGIVRISGERSSGRYLLRVADDGPGIDAEVAAQIFVPGRSTKSAKGRGVGLAGCRLLLARYGGGLELLPSKGRGAVFSLDLPLVPEAEGQEVETPFVAAEAEETGKAGELKVLVVDDELSMREMLGEVLSELGCTVTVAPDAESAQSLFKPGMFQVALLDQTLPGMSGVDLAGFLRKGDPCLAIFLMTGWGNPDVFKATAGSTIDFTARKPMEFKDLQRLLMEAVRLQAGRKASLNNES